MVDEPLIMLLEEALEAIGDDDGPLRSQLLSGLAQQLYWVDPAGRSADLGLEALEMARRIDHPKSLAMALTRRQFLGGVGPAETERRLRESSELHALAKRLGDLELEMRAHVYRLRDYLELGQSTRSTASWRRSNVSRASSSSRPTSGTCRCCRRRGL